MQHPAFISRCSNFPNRVLLDTVAHMGRCRDNATTAVGKTSDGCDIEISFMVADPPSLTRCVVDCSHLTYGVFFEDPPLITGADGGFLLLIVTFPEHPDRIESTDLFVYKSGPGTPSLEVLPRPYPVGYQYTYVGVLSCGDHCLVVIPNQRLSLLSFDLHIFSTKTKTKSWSTKVVSLDCGVTPHGCLFRFNRVFALGGGSIAWVDHQNGILLCDAVDSDRPKARLIQLPPLMPVNAYLGVGYDGLMPCLDRVRDVTFSRSNGCFRIIEVGYPKVDPRSRRLNFRWKAAMSKMKIHSDKWEPCGTINYAELSPTYTYLPGLFPAIWDSENKKLSLNNVIISYPTLDMYNEDIVYILAKIKSTDPSGWVIAVNTKNKKLEKISSFSKERLDISRFYLQSGFSNHISGASDINLDEDLGRCTNRQKIEYLDNNLMAALDLGRCTNRQKIEYLENNLMAALDLLRSLEINAASLNRKYNGSTSLVFSGSTSSHDPQIQTDHGLNNSKGDSAASEHLRLMGDLELLFMSPIDAIKSKIRAAHGALYKIMETLPFDLAG